MDNQQPQPVTIETKVKRKLSRKSPPFELKDYITISISCLAVIITGINFYFSNIKVDNKAMASVVELSQGNDSIKFKIAYINTGNRQMIIQCPGIGYFTKDLKSQIIGDQPLEDLQKQFPVVLNPHEMKLVNLGIAITNILHSMQENTHVESFSQKNFNLYYDLIYDTISSNGETRLVTSNVISKIFVLDNKSISRSIPGPMDFPKTDLIDN